MNDENSERLLQLRAQSATVERQIAEATLPAAQAYASLLGSPEVDQLMAAITSAAAKLMDDTTSARVTMFAKMRADLVILANADVDRMQKMIAPEQVTS